MAPLHLRRSPLPRLSWILLGSLTMLAGPVPGRADSWTLDVAGTANLYGAGHATPPAPDGHGAGILPPGVALPTAPERVLRILSTSGTVKFSPSAPPNGADGAVIGTYLMPDWGGLSAYRLYNIARLLSGVFLSDSEPVDPPPAKLLADSLTFPAMAPALRQIFPIGDGLVGTAAGDTQLFVVPAGATRLFLRIPRFLHPHGAGLVRGQRRSDHRVLRRDARTLAGGGAGRRRGAARAPDHRQRASRRRPGALRSPDVGGRAGGGVRRDRTPSACAL